MLETEVKCFKSNVFLQTLIKVNNTKSGYIDWHPDNANTGFGYGALYSNTTGYSNTVNGYKALYSNTTGFYNAVNGFQALYSNISGGFNIANGCQSLYSGTTGSANIANGYQALYSNTTGNGNIANGYQSLYSNTTGSYNTANGYQALNFSTGNDNTANGAFSLPVNTTGNYNTANGYQALFLNTTGNDNTANGFNALISNTTGSNNTALGWGADVFAGDLSNATAIGNGAIVNASNKVRIGNTAVTVIEGQVDWSFPSDGRFKTNITETVKGLDFIMRLRPVVYNFQTKKYDEFIRGNMPDKTKFVGEQDFSTSESIRHSGFVAQEVEQAAKEAAYDFNGVIVPENDKQTYSLSYAQFVVPLVKAVQEQQQQIDDLSKKNEELEKRLAKLEALLAAQSR